MEFEVPLGGELEITLASAGHREGTTYELRSQPQFGTAGPIRQTLDGKGVFRYQHDPGRGTGVDTFFYRARNRGCTPSAKAAISIKVYLPPATLECSLGEFQAAPVGGSSEAVFQVRNSGGSRYSAELQVSPPWRPQQAFVDIGPGEASSIRIGFFPESTGMHYGTLHLAGDPPKNFRLEAEGNSPFEVSPDLLSLSVGANLQRGSSLLLLNTASRKLEIEFATPPGILPVPRLSLEPAKQAEVQIQANPAFPGRSSGQIEIVEGSFKVPLRFEAPALPARLELTPNREVVFPACAEGGSSSVELGIANLGGEECQVSLKPPKWIRAERTDFSLGPGQRVSIGLTAFPTGVGTLREPVGLVTNGGQTERIVALASILGEPPVHPNPNKQQSLPPSDLRRIAREALSILHISAPTSREVRILWRDQLPGKFEYRIHWLEITSSSALELGEVEKTALLETPAAKFPPEKFAAQRLRWTKIREKAPSENQIVKRWHMLRNAQIRQDADGTFELRFPAPRDRYSIRLRISRILPDGSTSPTRTEVHVPLEPEKSNGFPRGLVLVAMGSVLALYLLWWARKKFATTSMG